MEIKFAVLCDAANVSKEDKLNVTGIFDRITVQGEFPALFPRMMLVVRVQGHATEVGSHRLIVRLCNADGKQLFSGEGPFELKAPWAPGVPTATQFIFDIAGTVFNNPGTYAFDILIDGRYEETVPLYVVRVPAMPPKV